MLIALSESVAIAAAEWRNSSPEACRTPILSTAESQRDWYACLDTHRYRYWAVADTREAFGIAGLTNISWENRSAEISLVISPKSRGQGLGKEAALELVRKGFEELNLEVIYGECYQCTDSPKFWHKVFPTAEWVILPDRKYWKGKYWDAEYFSIKRPAY